MSMRWRRLFLDAPPTACNAGSLAPGDHPVASPTAVPVLSFAQPLATGHRSPGRPALHALLRAATARTGRFSQTPEPRRYDRRAPRAAPMVVLGWPAPQAAPLGADARARNGPGAWGRPAHLLPGPVDPRCIAQLPPALTDNRSPGGLEHHRAGGRAAAVRAGLVPRRRPRNQPFEIAGDCHQPPVRW